MFPLNNYLPLLLGVLALGCEPPSNIIVSRGGLDDPARPKPTAERMALSKEEIPYYSPSHRARTAASVAVSERKMRAMLPVVLRARAAGKILPPPEVGLKGYLPDQRFASNRDHRALLYGAIMFPCGAPDGEARRPVLIATDIYANARTVPLPGDDSRTTADGFWLVGYEDGTVRRIAARNVRRTPDGDVRFPGQRDYARARPYYDSAPKP